jgi:predicted acetyltransferase
LASHDGDRGAADGSPMTESSFSIAKVGPESEGVLRNLFPYYLHDMAEWFDIDTDADGTYPYDISAIWGKYDVFLAKVGDSLAGFALIESGAVHDIGEFFVLRKFRRQGVGQKMAIALWRELRGPWQVRVCETNLPAMPFWRAAISRYTGGAFEEEERSLGGRGWRFFRFVSAGDPSH